MWRIFFLNTTRKDISLSINVQSNTTTDVLSIIEFLQINTFVLKISIEKWILLVTRIIFSFLVRFFFWIDVILNLFQTDYYSQPLLIAVQHNILQILFNCEPTKKKKLVHQMQSNDNFRVFQSMWKLNWMGEIGEWTKNNHIECAMHFYGNIFLFVLITMFIFIRNVNHSVWLCTMCFECEQ